MPVLHTVTPLTPGFQNSHDLTTAVREALAAWPTQIIIIVGEQGTWKTTLAQRLHQILGNDRGIFDGMPPATWFVAEMDCCFVYLWRDNGVRFRLAHGHIEPITRANPS